MSSREAARPGFVATLQRCIDVFPLRQLSLAGDRRLGMLAARGCCFFHRVSSLKQRSPRPKPPETLKNPWAEVLIREAFSSDMALQVPPALTGSSAGWAKLVDASDIRLPEPGSV